MRIPTEKQQFVREYSRHRQPDKQQIDRKNPEKIKLVHRLIETLKSIMLTKSLAVDLKKAGWTSKEILDFFTERSDQEQLKLCETRQFLGFHKWVPLEIMVSFIDTVKKDQDQTLRNRYDDYLNYSISNRDLRRKLAEEHDVKPRELDGIIKNQSEEENRSIVEIVSNACDYSEKGGDVEVSINSNGYDVRNHGNGMTPTQIFERLLIPKSSGSAVEKDDAIGIFGMGFYTALSHLVHEGDQLTVETSDGNQGYVIFLQLRYNKIKVRTSARNDLQSGTYVSLDVQEFDQDDATRMLKEYMKYNRHANIELDEDQINNIEHLTRIEEEILTDKNDIKTNTQCEVTICVHGVKIEGIQVRGYNIPKELVIDLSRNTKLAENRTEIAIDSTSIKEIQSVINKISQLENPIPILNALYPIIAILQSRNKMKTKEANLLQYLKQRTSQVLPKDKTLVPNTPGFQLLDVPNPEYVHPGYHRFNYSELPGSTRCYRFKSENYSMYLLDFKDEADEVLLDIKEHNVFILDRSVYERHKEHPELLELYINVGLNASIGKWEQPKRIIGHVDLPSQVRRRPELLPTELELSPVSESLLDAHYQQFQKAGDFSPWGYDQIIFGKGSYSLTNHGDLYEVRDYIWGESETYSVPDEHSSDEMKLRLKQTKAYFSWFNKDNFRIFSQLSAEQRRESFFIFLQQFLTDNPELLKEYRDYESNQLLSVEDNIARIISDINRIFNGNLIKSAKIVGQSMISESFGETAKSFFKNLERVDQMRYIPTNYQAVFDQVFSNQNAFWISDYNYDEHFRTLRNLCSKDLSLVKQFVSNVLLPTIDNPLIPSNELFKQLELFINIDQALLDEAQEKLAELRQRQAEIQLSDTSRNSDLPEEVHHKLKGNGKMFGDEYMMGRGRYRVLDYSAEIAKKEKEIRKLKQVIPGLISLRNNGANFSHNMSAFLQIPALSDLVKKTQAELDSGSIRFVDDLCSLEVERMKDGSSYESFSIFYRFPQYSKYRFSPIRLNLINTGLLNNFDLDLVNKTARKRLELYLQKCWKSLGATDETFSRFNIIIARHPDKDFGDSIYHPHFLDHIMSDLGHYNDIIIADYLQFYSGITEGITNIEELDRLRQKSTIMWDHIAQKSSEEYARIVQQFFKQDYSTDSHFKFFSDDSIPARDIPRDIRGYVLYMRTPEAELLNSKPEDYLNLNLNSYTGCSLLSQLSITKSLNQERLSRFESDPEKLSQFIIEQSEGKDAEIAQREIRHAMQYLSVNDEYLFIRELMSNSIEAIKREANQLSQNNVKAWPIPHWLSQSRKIIKTRKESISSTATTPQIHIEHFLRETSIERMREIYLQIINNALTPEMYIDEKNEANLDEFFTVILNNMTNEDLFDPIARRQFFDTNLSSFGGILFQQDEWNNLIETLSTINPNKVMIVAQDEIGMTFQEVINNLLVPGEKADFNKTKFGQKFFTVLQNAEHVFIKTSIGDGQVTYCKLTPIKNGDDEIVDVQLDYEIKSGENFKGTMIQKEVDSDFPELEAALLKNASITYGSLVDADLVKIEYANTQINQPRRILARINIDDIGEMKIYDAPENSITQNGIFVRDLDDEYWKNVPDHVKELLIREKLVIDLPPGVELIVSGNNIARKQQILPKLQKHIPILAIQAYLVKFQEGDISIEELPYDYFSQQYGAEATRRRNKINTEIKKDARKISRGELLHDYERYFDRDAFVQLITLIPSIKVGSEILSLFDVAERASKGEEFDLPPKIKSLVAKSKDFMKRVEDQEKAFIASGQKEHEDYVPALNSDVSGTAGTHVLLMNMTRHILNLINGERIKLGVYYKPDGSKAHAMKDAYFVDNEEEQFSLISWNLLAINQLLEFLRTQSTLTEETPMQNNRSKFYYELFNTVTHERQHIDEGSASWTHNSIFYEGQKRFIKLLLKNPDFTIKKFEEAFSQQFEGLSSATNEEFMRLIKMNNFLN